MVAYISLEYCILRAVLAKDPVVEKERAFLTFLLHCQHQFWIAHAVVALFGILLTCLCESTVGKYGVAGRFCAN